MSQSDSQSVDAILNQIQTDADAVKAAAGPGDAEAVDGAAAAISEIAGDMDVPPPHAPGSDPTTALLSENPPAADFAPPAFSDTSGHTDIHRLLAIEVPVIVQLGMKRMSMGEVMRLAVGAIVEFGKPAEEELDLLANNKNIGRGHAVKVGENFGIKISHIGSVKEMIRKLGAV